MKYLDPKNDLTFKHIFGEHPHLLKSFLNAMLPLPEDNQIVSLEYLTPELVPEIPLFKDTIVDVRCKDLSGRHFIVEMQMNWTSGFMQRVLFNSSKAYVKQLEKGDIYELLQPVYALNLINDTFSPLPNYYHHYQIVEVEHHSSKIEGLEFVFVELDKFKATSFTEKKLQILWLRFMTEIDEKTAALPEELANQPEINEALTYLHESAFTPDQLLFYEKFWDKVRRERTLKEESFAKGEYKGKAEGRAEGEQIGLEKGRAEGEQIGLYKSILNLLRNNIAIELISNMLSVDIELVKKLKALLDKYGNDAENYLDEIV